MGQHAWEAGRGGGRGHGGDHAAVGPGCWVEAGLAPFAPACSARGILRAGAGPGQQAPPARTRWGGTRAFVELKTQRNPRVSLVEACTPGLGLQPPRLRPAPHPSGSERSGLPGGLPAADLLLPLRLPPCEAPSLLPGCLAACSRPLGRPATHPGEADAADGPTQHVRENGRVRVGRGEVGEEVRAVPVGHLRGDGRSAGSPGCGAHGWAWRGGPRLASLRPTTPKGPRRNEVSVRKKCKGLVPEASPSGLPTAGRSPRGPFCPAGRARGVERAGWVLSQGWEHSAGLGRPWDLRRGPSAARPAPCPR